MILDVHFRTKKLKKFLIYVWGFRWMGWIVGTTKNGKSKPPNILL